MPIQTESFDTKPARWKDLGQGRYEFEIDGVPYYADIDEVNQYAFVEFDTPRKDHEKNYSLTDTGNQFKVFNTVIDIVKNWAANNPDFFVKEKGQLVIIASGKGRSSLYKRMIKRFLPIGWDVVAKPAPTNKNTTNFYIGPKENL